MKNLKAKYRYSLILLRELVITDFKLRYQGSVLGYLWSLLKPLFLFTMLYFVLVSFLKIGSDIPNWPVSLLFGIVLWNFFQEVVNNGLNAIVSRGDVIRKINFPKYIIVFSTSISAIINLVLSFVIIVAFMLIAGISLEWNALLMPVYVLELLVFGVGLSFILGTLQVYFRDTGYIWDVVSQALFYGSAIIYPIGVVMSQNLYLAKILLLNPVAQSIQDARHVFISDANPTLSGTANYWWMLVPVIIVIVTFVFGAWLFKKHSPRFAENV